MGLPYGSIPRKTVPREEQATAMDYSVLLDFGVRNVALYLTAYMCVSFCMHHCPPALLDQFGSTWSYFSPKIPFLRTPLSLSVHCGSPP